MTKRKIINIYKVKQDIQGSLPTGETDENYEKLNFFSNNITNSTNVYYNNTTSKLQATNVQGAIDEIAGFRNIIRDGEEQFAGYYDLGKPVYYRAFRNTNGYPSEYYFNTNANEWNVDVYLHDMPVFEDFDVFSRSGGYNDYTVMKITQSTRGIRTLNIVQDFDTKLMQIILYYTKLTDSRIL